MRQSYKIGDLRRIIREGSEFKPKVESGVMRTNTSNNEKSYKDAEKKAKDFDGGLSNADKKGNLPDKTDVNRTTLDYTPRTEVGKDFSDKVDAQVKGYTSKLEMENDIEKSGEFDNNGKIKKQFTDASNKINAAKGELANSGLQGSKIKKEKRNTMYENTKRVAKRLKFKNTKFLNESQMLSRIPEEYKKDGQVIYMVDNADNEYIVECALSEKTGIVETNVVKYQNKKVLSEQLDRINQLFAYEHEKTFAPNPNAKINEGAEFINLMNLTRKEIIK